MNYPYFDILFDMAEANVAPTKKLRLHYCRESVKHTRYGPNHESKAFYTTPEGDRLIDQINRKGYHDA